MSKISETLAVPASIRFRIRPARCAGLVLALFGLFPAASLPQSTALPVLTLQPGVVNRTGPASLYLILASVAQKTWTFQGSVPFNVTQYGYGFSNGSCKGGGTYIGQFQQAGPGIGANRTYDSNWPTHTLTLHAGWTDRTIFVYDKAAVVGSGWSTPATWFACGSIPDNLPTTGWVPPALTLKPGVVNRAGPTQLPLLALSAPNRSWTFKGNLPFDPTPFGFGYSNGDCKGGGATFIAPFYPDQPYNEYGKDAAIKVDAVNRLLTLRVPWNVRTVFVFSKSPPDIWAKPDYWYACGTIPDTVPRPPDK